MKKSIISLLLIMCFVLSCAPLSALATDTPTEVIITFIGDEADKAGFMQSTITVIPGDGAALDGYYTIYYTDGVETLKDYDELGWIEITDGSSVSCTVKDGTMIPVGAKGIAVFESKKHFNDTTPSIKNAVATASIPASKQTPDLGKAELSFGAISDVHMNYEQHNRGAYAKWESALDFFASEGIEHVLVAGDMTGDRGENPDLEAQYEQYVSTIKASDIDFDHVYECIGNHGNTPADIGLFTSYLSGKNEVHPYANSPYYHILIKGETRDNLFIFMRLELTAPGGSASAENFSKAQIDWLESLLKQYSSTKTNIFVALHSPFLNYGAGDRKNGGYTALITFKTEYAQTMRLKGLLETYKNVIVMSGHTHVSLYDGVNYSDEYNSFARTVHIGSGSQPCAYGTGSTYVRSTDGRYSVTPEYGSEAYTVSVYKDFIVYTGYNLSTGKIIPAACLIIPVTAYGGAGNPNLPKDPDDVFEGKGTSDDPYIIADADDFMAFTAGFNASNSTVESEMYGYGKHFKQIADIDMTNYYGYSGTEANGNAKAFFAGIYNGDGHTLTVNINGTNQRSVFPYVYGVIANLCIKGSIKSDVSAQPVRTLYGSVINCIFDVDVYANNIANGIIYSNYSFVYNVYTKGTLSATNAYPVASNDTSTQYHNVFYDRTNASGESLSDEHGSKATSLNAVVSAFNSKTHAQYQTALSKLSGVELKEVTVKNGVLVFESPVITPPDPDPNPDEYTLGDVNNDGAINQYDYILVKRHYFGTRILNDAEMKPADVNNDKKVDQYDYILICRHYFGTYKIG